MEHSSNLTFIYLHLCASLAILGRAVRCTGSIPHPQSSADPGYGQCLQEGLSRKAGSTAGCSSCSHIPAMLFSLSLEPTAWAELWFNACDHGLHVNITAEQKDPKQTCEAFKLEAAVHQTLQTSPKESVRTAQNTSWNSIINKQLSAGINGAILQMRLKNPLLTGERAAFNLWAVLSQVKCLDLP